MIRIAISILLFCLLLIDCCAASGATLTYDIIEAVNHNNVEKLKDFIKKDPSLVSSKTPSGETLLHYASYADSKEAVEFLISQGAMVDEKNDYGETPLHKVHTVEMAEILISHGADEKSRTRNGETMLHLATQSFDADLIRFYISKGAEIDARNSSGMTPLHYAVRSRRKEAVELLLAHGADTNAADKYGDTPLSVAVNKEDVFSQCLPVKSGRKAIVKALLAHGARVNNISEAIAAGDLNTVKSLISSNPDLSGITGKDNGETLLWRAVYWERKEIVEFLISSGADVNGKCESGTPLHVSSKNGSSEITELLISKGAHVNSVAWSGTDTPLYYLVMYGDNQGFYRSKDIKSGKESYQVFSLETNTGENHIKVAKLLIAAGALVDLKSHYTPLHAAVIKNWKEMAELLIAAGADVNSCDDEMQRTSLHMAAECGNRSIAELLISKGADVNAMDKDGKTPLKLASEKGWSVIVDLLRRHGGRE